MKKAILILCVLLLVVPAALFAGGSTEAVASGADSKMGGVLVFGRSGDSVSLDPGRETDGESFYASTAVFDTLVEFVPGETAVQPALAKSWDVSANGLEYVFHLREGVKFHDGSAFDANDVVMSLIVQWDAANPFHTGNTGAFSYWSGLWGAFLNAPAQ